MAYMPFYDRSTDAWTQRIQKSLMKGVSAPPGFGGPDYGLAGNINQFMTGQAIAPWQANQPFFNETFQQAGQNALQQTQGKVTDPTINQLLQGAAQRGIITGSPGSPGANSAYLAALGKTSEQQQVAGLQGFGTLAGITPVPEIWNPLSLYVPERLARLEESIAQGAERGPQYGGRSRTTYTGTPAYGLYPSLRV